jgi:hypothetical protein
MLSPVQPGSVLSNWWNNITNQFVYGTGTQWDEFPTTGLNIPALSNPPTPNMGAQVPGTSVYIDPVTGVAYTPTQMLGDWWTQIQTQLAAALNNVPSGDGNGDGTGVSWLWWVVGGVVVLYMIGGNLWSSNVRHGR